VDANGGLHVGDDHVSVVYFRSGYTPDDYPGEAEWVGRSLMECSTAVKCPSIRWHLAGAKKVQQELARPGVLERFVDAGSAALLRGCFAGLWALDGPDADEVVSMALAEPEGYVLKPQREGGGNNYYGAELSAFLRDNHGSPVLSSYVLMQRIFPKARPSVLVRTGEVKVADCISELGVYGTFLGDGSSQPRLNHCAGYLLRTKPAGVDEGGVATGYSVLSSVVLL
jgi:glutathione synthase